jgi:tetratricopeptide (TPR) repeat protein
VPLRAFIYGLILSLAFGASAGAQQPQMPAQPQFQFNVWTLLNQARTQIQQGNPQKALEYSQQFINLRPLEPEGYFWQGVAYDNLLQTGLAVQSYDRAVQGVLKAGMDSAELRMNLGNDLMKLKRVDDAIAQYRRAVQIDPQLPLAHLNLGRALVEKGETSEAMECFQRCEDLHFKPSQLAYYRAKALIRAGRPGEAQAHLQTALSTFGETSPVSQKLKQEFSQVLPQQPPTGTADGGTSF